MSADGEESGTIGDDSLVEAVRRDDTGAFAPLLDRHLGRVHAFIALKLPVPHLVDEIAHETFVFAYRNLDRFTPGTSLPAWLRAIAANKVRAEIERYCRERSNRLGYAEHRLIELAASTPDEDASREAEAMRFCLEEVPSNLRELLRMKYGARCSADEMARRLSRSAAWVRTTLFRVRQQLRACIETRLKEECR